MATLLYGTGVYGDTYGEAEGAGSMASVSSEPVDDRLFVAITHANGRKSRWGPDEPDASGIPQNIQVSSSSPGGFKDFGCTLARDPRRDWPDLDLLDEVEVYGRSAPLGRKAFEGQQEQFPSQLGDSFEIAVNAIGWQAALEDRKDFREIYVDRELSQWQGPSIQRKLNLVGSYTAFDPSVVPDKTNGQPSLATLFTGDWAAASKPTAEGFYDAQGIPLGSLYFAWKKNGANVNELDGNWSWSTFLSTDDVFSSFDNSGELRAAGPGTGTLNATTATRDSAMVQLNYNAGPAGSANQEYAMFWTCLAVYGNHGLTKRGTSSVTEAQGFYGHDILADLVSGAPPLTYEVGKTIAENTSFVVPQLAFLSPTTRWDAIQQLNAYFLWRLEIWENKKVWWQPWDPGPLTWKARIQGGAHWSPAGRQASTLFNGVVVSYNDVSGQRKTAGPPGSGADDESALLEDTSTDNPVTSHDRIRWELIDVGFPLTGGAAGSAVQIGYVWMQEHQIPQRRGTLVVKPLGPGHIPQLEHPTAGPLPIWACRPGDFVELVDFPDREPFRVLEASYDHQSKTGTFQLDNSALKLDGILARVGIRSQGVF